MHIDSPTEALAGFTAATRAWFEGAFERPTAAQLAAWQAIRDRRHALVIAPTGSGKTLAAFLHSLDRLASTPPTGKVRVLYISPLKALAVDVERNLRVPLRGMQAAARQLGLPEPEVRVALRSGDTPAAQRKALLRHPPDILITTPESLFLMLSSSAAEMLTDLETIIVDEVHALAGTKRGAHLALSLERLSAPGNEPQRIGLSATVDPADQVAAFLGGDRLVSIIEPAAQKNWQLSIEVPVADMTELRRPNSPDGTPNSNSIWPWVTPRILELIDQHKSTICFVNSRRLAERLTAALNELHAQRQGAEFIEFAPPADYIARSGASPGYDGSQWPILARAHHGSVSKQHRLEIESDLKAGRLPCVVATSSLELGIDMGAVELVIQVQAPSSVASALQRIGRAGHDVDATSRGVIFPTSRGDLLESAVIVERMTRAQLEPLTRLRNPLDVLAQQLVSCCVNSPRSADELFRLVQRADPYRELTRPLFDAVVDMLCGRYPSEQFAELRPRLARQAEGGVLTARPGARQLVTTSGGTIPDRGNYPVYLAGTLNPTGRSTTGRRVGELDEEMVYESRTGDIFTLGTTSWRIEEITTNHVVVSPAPGSPGRLPFWHGDSMARPIQLGQAIGVTIGQLATEPQQTVTRLRERAGLDDSAAANLIGYVRDQQQATGIVPDDHTIVIERFRDELGDWRVCVLSSLGKAVLTPLAMALRHELRHRYGSDPEVMATNDGIVLRIPDTDAAGPGAEIITDLDPAQLPQIIETEVGSSALFAARFRECATRALLLPRRRPGQRSPLWQQRHRAAQLLQVAREYPDFPIVLEAMRECLHDVFDLAALGDLLTSVQSRQLRVVAVETQQASPFARQLLFNLVGNYIYDGDQPVAERRLAALSLDPDLLADLLGRGQTDELFDRVVADELTAELQRLAPGWRATDIEQLWDVTRRLGPLSLEELTARTDPAEQAAAWVDELVGTGRLAWVEFSHQQLLVVSEDLAWLGEKPLSKSALARLAERWTSQRVVIWPDQLTERFGIDQSQVLATFEELQHRGVLVAISFDQQRDGPQFCHQQVFDRLKRRTLARLRAAVEPVPQAGYARFLPLWQELDSPGVGIAALAAAIDQLAGVALPASMLETMVLPARVADYQPAMLDELLADGQVRWSGAGRLGDHDGWVQLWPGDIGLVAVEPDIAAIDQQLADRLACGGAWRAADLATEQLSAIEAEHALWRLAWAGLISTDSFAPVRQWCGRRAGRRGRPPVARRRLLARTVVAPVQLGVGARWAALPRGNLAAADQLVQDVGLLLGRHGLLTKPVIATERLVDSFAAAYQVLAAAEERGAVRRGYFVTGLGGAQFALPGAIDRLRDISRAVDQGTATGSVLLLAACDPANPYGAALPWPAAGTHRPNRGAGALVMLADGELICYLERGARSLLSFCSPTEPVMAEALQVLVTAVTAGRIDELTIERVDGELVLSADQWHKPLLSAGFAMVPQGFRCRR